VKLKQILLRACFVLSSTLTVAAPLQLSDVPLGLNQAVSPLTMLVMGRDHKLYYEAYNDAADLNHDGTLNIRFNPQIVYYGYFDTLKCYDYNGNYFYPTSAAQHSANSHSECSGKWNGNYLNYVTTARIDALRKVLYGGYRSTDRTSRTILERSYIPQDAHSWGKSYTSIAVDGFDISRYTPYSTPQPGYKHLFANTTLLNGDGSPLLRVATNVNHDVWQWLSIERPVAGDHAFDDNNNRVDISEHISDYKVRVKVCVPGLLEENCRAYHQGDLVRYKPVGLLQELGEGNQMKFGLLTGSYGHNLSGGVLRKNIGSISDEINLNTGQFTTTNGIIQTLNKLRIIGFGGSHYTHQRNCGYIFNRDIVDGECRMWGNPVAEMMYETLRYFAGKKNPTPAYVYSGGDDEELGLPKPTWQDPYAADQNPWCAKANLLLISDLYPSYDSDKIPGSAFSSFQGDLSPSLNVAKLGDEIWRHEFGGSRTVFIGESLSDSVRDGAPTAKTVTSFGNIRGLVPEEPNKKGSYYAASVAYYAWQHDLNPGAKNKQNLHTFVVALASPFPEFTIPVAGKEIKLIPFGKSVGALSDCVTISSEPGDFQPTNTIVDFYVEQLSPTSGTFRINFEDAQQGADHDMDAVVKYHYQVNPDDTITITLDSVYAAGCVIQHLGYVISGTTADGTYLEVRDADTPENKDINYYLDTPNTGNALPQHTSRTFTVGQGTSAKLLKSPLWYAAKWGNFDDKNNNQVPDLESEHDKSGDGVPDNYFLVTNALNLKSQLSQALNNIAKRDSSFTRAALSSSVLSQGSLVFQSLFNSVDWTGHLVAYPLDPAHGELIKQGTAYDGAQWDTAEQLKQQHWRTGRRILSYDPARQRGIAFDWDQLSSTQQAELRKNPHTDALESTSQGYQRWQYLRGLQQHEQQHDGAFRNRSSLLGDIIRSSPVYVGKLAFNYFHAWPPGSAENEHPYADFQVSVINKRPPMLYAGANDGMLHAINAETGEERFAYIPSAVIPNLSQLTTPAYQHKSYVDATVNYADVFTNNKWRTVLIAGLGGGGKGVYALDITKPQNTLETQASQTVLWEFDNQQRDSHGQSITSELGYVYGRVAIVRLANGQWAAIVGNGYNNTVGQVASSTGNAVLYIIDIETGALIKKFDTGVGMAQDPLQLSRPNGLATPVVLDVNNNSIADTVYAGDLFGNLWKFDIHSSQVAQWHIALNGKPLFVASRQVGSKRIVQPITTRPTISRVRQQPGVFQIYFGTGKFLEANDKIDLSLQSFYAIRDNGSNQPVSLQSLQKQEFYNEFTVSANGQHVLTARSSSQHPLLSRHLGWYLDLLVNQAQGERVITDPMVRQEKLIFTTLIPHNDPCEAGGDSWLVELEALTGTPLPYAPFDLTGDREFTREDYVSQQEKHISARKSEVGIIATPVIVSDLKHEYKISSGSSGSLESIAENPGYTKQGRQSWVQLQ
jgi:type IV pilus assembly protein PilY1